MHAGGGELIDQGIHLIDLARWFLGDFTEVQGFAPTYFLPLTKGSLSATPVIHAHGIIFFAWSLFFVFQSWLAASGRLDLRMGGPGYRDFKVSSAGGNETYTVFDALGGEFNRRSLYRAWPRTGTSPLLDLLDCPDPSVAMPRLLYHAAAIKRPPSWPMRRARRASRASSTW